MTFGTAENIFNGGLLTNAERDFVMRDSNAFLFGLIADQSVKAGIASLSWQYGAVFVGGSRKTYIGIRRLRREYLGQCDCHGNRRAVGGVLWNQPQKGFTCLFAALARFGCRNIR